MDEKNDLQNLDRFVIGSQRNGQPVLRIGFEMQLYVRGGSERETRRRAVDVLAGFAAAASGNLSHWQRHMASRMTPIKGQDLAALLRDEVERVDPQTELYGPHISDGQVPPRWQGAAMLQPGSASVDLSSLHLAMPAVLASEDPDDLIARLAAWCAQLRPLHGTAGLAPVYEIGMEASYPDETWPMLSRFSGLDYRNAFAMAARGVDAIRAVNWLTILGDPVLETVGGMDALSRRLADAAQPFAALGPDVLPQVHPYAGGALIRAGRYPQLGDRNIGGVPESYRIVFAALREHVFTGYDNRPTRLIPVPRPLDAHDETLRWITRFGAEG